MATKTAAKRGTTRKAGTAKPKGQTRRAAKTTASSNGEVSKREAQAARDAELTERMLELREDGQSWSEIGAELAITPGKAQFLMMLHKVATGEVKRLRFRNDDELAAVIAKARGAADEFSSWGWIAARTGVSEPKLKRLHEEHSSWKPRTENISIVRAAKHGGTTTTTTKRTAAKSTPAKGKTATASKAAKAKAAAKRRGRAADPS